MKKYFLILVLITVSINAQDMRQNALNSLFSDHKAGRIGDAITIIVLESSQASNHANTQTERESDLGFSGSANLEGKNYNAGANIGSNNNFSGSGSTQTGGMVRTKISATIDSIHANGNMRINGMRKIVINGEEQIIKITGIVRPSDIASDNSVLSYNISDAEIVFEGNGMITNNQEPGWLTKVFHWLF
jgi:flagellar L-ring protein precursor FlgH